MWTFLDYSVLLKTEIILPASGENTQKKQFGAYSFVIYCLPLPILAISFRPTSRIREDRDINFTQGFVIIKKTFNNNKIRSPLLSCAFTFDVIQHNFETDRRVFGYPRLSTIHVISLPIFHPPKTKCFTYNEKILQITTTKIKQYQLVLKKKLVKL